MELSGIVGKWFTGSCLKKNMESGIGDMLFHSLEFFIYFPVVVLVYFFIPKRCKCLWLLAASYYFYMSWNIGHTFLIAFSTFVTWVSGLLLGRCHRTGKRRYRKWIVAASVSLNLGILFYFKYFDFLLANLNMVITRMGFPMLEKPFEIVLPVGISFYTFQALGYTVDVYRGEVEPEKNLFRYALFVSFFPQLVAGPIERSKNLLWQIRRIPTMSFRRLWNYERIASGLILMLWGYFQKLVLADRLCILVDTVYQDWQQYGTAVLVLATAAFSMQIYCDFASYSIIAMGAAKVMGFTLMENFRAPYFSRSIQEFWRRWHISLSLWFRDYLYIPLGGSRRGVLRGQWNRMAVFLASGLWHGASWHYAAWGAIHGVYQAVGAQTEGIRRRLRKKAGVDTETFSFRFGQAMVTYILTLFALVFFRSVSMAGAFGYLKRVFTKPDPWVFTDGTLYQLGLTQADVRVLLAALVTLFFVSLIREYRGETLDVFLARQGLWFRWLVILYLFGVLFLFGMYGPEYDASQFIYFQF